MEREFFPPCNMKEWLEINGNLVNYNYNVVLVGTSCHWWSVKGDYWRFPWLLRYEPFGIWPIFGHFFRDWLAQSGREYSADEAAKWGVVGWLTSGGSTPLVDVFTQASADMVDLHLSVVFQALRFEKNYLRIQVINHQIQYLIIKGILLGKKKYDSSNNSNSCLYSLITVD